MRKRTVGLLSALLALTACTTSGGGLESPRLESGHESEDRERGVKEPRPFTPDSPATRRAIEALAVNSDLGEWRAVGPSNFGGKVYQIALDPFDRKTLFAAYEVGGLWGTRDSGTTWVPMHPSEDLSFSSVAFHPKVPGLVAAGLIAYGGGYFRSLNQHVGVRLSTDGGRTWSNIGPFDDSRITVWNIGFGDATGQVIYAATDFGLYKTLNQGGSWTNILDCSQSSFFLDRVSFLVSPLDPNVLLLAQRRLGVMRSVNGGVTWARVDNWLDPASADPKTAILAWSSKGVVYAETVEYAGDPLPMTIHRSANSGATWQQRVTFSTFNQGPYDMAIAVNPSKVNSVVIHNSYLHRSTDGFATSGTNQGYSAGPDSMSIVFDQTNPSVIYDGNDEGVWRSADGGNTWRPFDLGVLTTKSIGGSANAVGPDGKIYTNAADYSGQQYTPGWGWFNRPDGYEYDVYHVNPRDGNDLYRYTNELHRSPTSTRDAALIDPLAGTSSSYENRQAVAFDPSVADTLVVGKRGELYRSTDRGASWTSLGSFSSGEVRFVKYAPSNPARLYVLAGDRVWTSENGGGSWSGGETLAGPSSISVASDDERTLYASMYSGGVVKSSNAGTSFAPLGGFIGVTTWVLVDPVVPTRIFAALNNTVVVSEDGGATTQRIGSQFPNAEILWMAIVKRELVAGTAIGVWQVNLERKPPCSQVTIDPPSLVVGPLARTHTFEVFVAPSCNLNPTSSQPWATISTGGVTQGHAIVRVAVADNTAAAATRAATLTLAGRPVQITQARGSDAVRDGARVRLRRGSKCVARTGAGFALVPCAATTLQAFTLKTVGERTLGFSLSNVATEGCMASAERSIRSGAAVLDHGCTGEDWQSFTPRARANGTWRLHPVASLAASPLCLDVTATGATQRACSTAQDFWIEAVP